MSFRGHASYSKTNSFLVVGKELMERSSQNVLYEVLGPVGVP